MKKRKRTIKLALHELRKKWGFMVLSILVLVTISIGLGVRHLSSRSRAEGVESEPESLSEIIGGKPANPEDWKFFVIITNSTITPEQKLKFDFVCGGSLIRSRWVLTAAHCLSKVKLESAYVFIGASSLQLQTPLTIHAQGDISSCNMDERCIRNSEKVAFIKVARKIPHPEYVPLVNGNDIGLIELSEPVTNFEKYALAPLIGEVKNSDASYFNGGTVSVGGFGRINTRITPPSGTNKFAEDEYPLSMRELVIKIIARSPGNLELQTENKDTGTIAGICYGDSGGPVMYTSTDLFGLTSSRVQVGVISGLMPTEVDDRLDKLRCGWGDGQWGFDVYTNVFYYLPWIRSYTER